MKILSESESELYRIERPGIGASDVAAIMECDPWRSAYELFQIKIGRISQPDPNPVMLEGLAKESEALAFAQKKLKIGFEPQIIAHHDDYPFCYASADGWNSKKQIGIEIKCPRSSQTIDYLRKNSMPPEHYYLQMCQQISIFKPIDWYFFVYHNENDFEFWNWKSSNVFSPEDYWRESILGHLQKFQAAVSTGEWPALSGKASPGDERFDSIASDCISLKNQIEDLESHREVYLSYLKRLCVSKLTESENFKAEWRRNRETWKITVECTGIEAADKVMRAIEPLRSASEVKSIKENHKIENLSFFLSRVET